MGAKENETAVRRFLDDIWSKGDLTTAKEILDPSFAFVLAFARTDGLEQFGKMVNANRTAFENLTYTSGPDDVVATDEKAAAYWTMTSKHVGAWRNIPGTNKDVAIKGITFFRFGTDGKIKEAYVHNDVLGLMRQIGGVKLLFEG